MIAALYVEAGGCYFGLEGVDPWPESRDARSYTGPYAVVAHPPCKRWGRYWGGAPRKPHQYGLGADNGCFAAALGAVTLCNGVLEHPKDSHAWEAFGLAKPPASGGWVRAGLGWTCCVEQGHYGHFSRKATWLYASGCALPDFIWGSSGQRLPAYAVERYGYEKARRIGVMAAVGGKDKERIRGATPAIFRDILLSIAESGNP